MLGLVKAMSCFESNMQMTHEERAATCLSGLKEEDFSHGSSALRTWGCACQNNTAQYGTITVRAIGMGIFQIAQFRTILQKGIFEVGLNASWFLCVSLGLFGLQCPLLTSSLLLLSIIYNLTVKKSLLIYFFIF